jgi:hypothetical protein
MMTAGTAATRPIAVASNASAIPGATTARFVVCDFEMPIKAFMMPQTVPNKPTKGAVAPIVASRCVPRVIPLPARASILDSSIASRSLTPSADRPSERRVSFIASSTRMATGPLRVHPDWTSRAPSARLLACRSL